MDQYPKNPQPAGARPTRPDEGVKNPEVAALLRNQLAPDSSPDVIYPGTPTTNSFDGAKGSVPGGTQAVPAPYSNDPRTAPKSGNAGPM